MLSLDELKQKTQDELWAICDEEWKSPELSGLLSENYGDGIKFGRDSHFYSCPTENIKYAIEYIAGRYGISGKKVLTLGCSGDTIRGFLLKRAEHVTAIDISKPACHWEELYTLAGSVLNGADLNFFAGECENILESRKTHKPGKGRHWEMKCRIEEEVMPLLSKASQEFWKPYFKPTKRGYKEVPAYSKARHSDWIPRADASIEHSLDLAASSMILNLPIGHFLGDISSEFDVVYLSNLPGYVTDAKEKNILLMESVRALKDWGILVVYSQSPADEFQMYYEFASESWHLSLDFKGVPYKESNLRNGIFVLENRLD
jgi:hypothetical protein